MIGLTFAEQLRRAVMPPDILELQEEYNDLRRRRIAWTVRYFEEFMRLPPLEEADTATGAMLRAGGFG